MKRILSMAMFALLFVLYGPPFAHTAPPVKGEKKDSLVLMPLRLDEMDKSMLGAMETALVEGLQDRYTVYAGENVAKKAREIFTKESRVKKECDETRCMQDIAMAFQTELIAVAQVTKRKDGYFLALSVRNIFDEKTVYSKSLPCEGCSEYQVVGMLKSLAGGGTSALAGSAPAAPPPSKGKPAPTTPVASPAVPSVDFSLDELDAQAKAEEDSKAAEKAKWDKYLTEMKKAFGQVENYQKRDISKELKAAAWERFLKTYKDDDPYSGEDDEMRDKAKDQVESIKRGDTAASDGMVFVKGGCYQMGDMFGDGYDNEKPVHEVCVDDFYMGKYEVTQKEWTEVMGSNPSNFKGCDTCPVEQVNWDDVHEFINKLKQKTGDDSYRLPTEAEWEYAARSGGKKEKFAGTSNESELGSYAWYNSNSGEKTHPVGQKKPNGLGLYDMSGNVWEWVEDGYDSRYYRRSPKDNPKGPTSGNYYRVYRGGSWAHNARIVRSAYRIDVLPDYRVDNLGFRLVRTR